jgi:D-glycero-alpha-D-manno-heptose-7-phosphate kinase
MKIIKKVQAPVRIDFAGGTTDIAYFANKYGGAVLNAAINRYVTGSIVKTDEKIHLEYTGNTPTSSGLGTSGVMNLVWLALISEIKLKRKEGIKIKTKEELAEKVYNLEQAMGIVGGKQDQYAGTFGGINFLQFKKDKVLIEQLNLNEGFIKELENSLVLVYTGKPHFAGSANKNMIDNIKKGRGVENLIRIRNIAKEMKNCLLKEDLDGFSMLMNEETENRIKLHSNVLPANVKAIMKSAFSNGAKSAKICGSGNGGSILFLGDKNKLKKRFGKSVIDFRFDFEGLKWIQN